MNLNQQILEVKINFFGRSVTDICKAIDGFSLMGAHILIFCLINYIAYLREGDKKRSYNRFIDDYLSKLNKRYKSVELYAIRCALVHTYGFSRSMRDAGLNGYSFSHKRSDLHLTSNSGVLCVNLSNFLFDVVKSVWLCFDDFLEVGAQDKGQIVKRGQKLLKVSGPDGEPIYHRTFAEMHACLAPLDRGDENKWELLNKKIWELCVSK